MAAPAWGKPGQVFRLLPAARNSVEGLLRRLGQARSVIRLGSDAPAALGEWRPQRAIGAVFDAPTPDVVYSRTQLATEFDAAMFLDQTKAVSPLP
jgi:erythromycin esterase-like protein